MPFPISGNGEIRGFGLALGDGACTVTTNMVTARGNVANLVDAPDNKDDLRPFTRATVWAPQVLYGETAGEGIRFARTDGFSGIGGNQGRFIQWDFGEPTSVGLMRFRITTEADFGVWQLYCSQDGENFTAEGNPIHLGGPDAGADNDTAIYDTRKNIQIPTGAPHMVTYGNGFTAMPNRIYESDVEPQVYFINTKFYRYFRLDGISTFIPSFPWDGAGSLPPSDIWCLDLTSSDIPGLVWQTPYTLELDPVEGYPEADLVPPVPGGVPSYLIDPVDYGPQPGPGPGGPNWNPSNGDGAGGPISFVPPKSDYRSPFSKGSRSTPVGTTEYGNSLVLAIPQHVEPPHEYAALRFAFNNNFGAGSGDGPYYQETAPGFYHQFTFTDPIMLTGIKLITDGPADLDWWKLQGFSDIVGDYIDLSTDQRLVWDGSFNDPYGRAFELVTDKAVVNSTLYRLMRGGSNPLGGGGRLATEIHFKVAGSFLEGGDRRTGTDTIGITTTFGMSYNNASPINAEQLAYLIDGQMETYNGGGAGLAGTGITFNGGLRFLDAQDNGRYFQFAFARQVRVKWGTVHISGSTSTFELLASGAPTRWGMWKWMASEDGITFSDVGEAFHLTENADDPLLDGGNDDPNYYGFWRLVKVSGTISTSGEWQEFTFLLDDLGEATPLRFVIPVSDEDGITIAAPTISEPSNPYSANLKDETVISVAVTIHYQLLLTGHLVDEGVIDVYSELSPSLATQSTSYQTGR